MAQKFLSPGVFTREIDQSFLAQGVQNIGAVLIGRTPKGPAFTPTIVGGFDEFVDRFGGPDPSMQLPYAAQNYLKNSAALTVVRVLGHADGTTTTNGYSVGSVVGIADMSASVGQVLATLHTSGGLGVTTIAGVPLDANNFIVTIGSIFAATASFLTSSDNYIGKVLNTDPTKYSKYGHYLYQVFSYATAVASASWTAVSGAQNKNTFLRDFASGSTSWVKSQPIGGLEFNLFRFHSLGAGRSTNDDFKVTVANVKPSPSPAATQYGTFDVIVRDFYDTDQRPVVLESFIGCNLDPFSRNYIARRIGDSYDEFDTAQRKFVSNGTFPTKSKLIRVELATDQNSPPTALPWGHRGYAKLTYGSGSTVPSFPYTLTQKDRNGNQDGNICWGVSFVSGGITDRMRAFPDNVTGFTGADSDFSLGYLTSSYLQGRQVWSYLTTSPYVHSAVYSSASLYKFTMPFQGGFDGWDLRVSDPLYLNNIDDETVIGVVSAKRAVDCVANPDAFDMNLLAIPGIHNLKTTDYARSMVNDRQDVFYVMDITGSTVDEAVQNLQSRQIDDNYSACYYPDLFLDDKTNNKTVRVSPSVAVVGTLAYTDRVGHPWFAPAGLTRGGLAQFNVTKVADRLNFKDRNSLYDNRINPIATFPDNGIVVWGQKTLQVAPSALDRVNVRRLLIFAKKTIASAAKFLVFEPNNPATWQRFTNMVNPILDKVRQDQGVERFKVVMDSNTNTPDVVDRNTMAGKIFLQPTKSAEFIDLSFVITNAGVAFGD